MSSTEDTALALVGSPNLADAPFTYKTLQAIATTQFVPKELRGKPDAILACIMYGREMGLGPMRSLAMIDVIDGRPSPSAELLSAKVREAGHRIRPGKISRTVASCIGERIHNGEVIESIEFEFTMDDAREAGLAGKTNYQKWPQSMLYWRAATFVARTFFSDVTGFKVYTPDELGDEEWHADIPEMDVPDVVDSMTSINKANE